MRSFYSSDKDDFDSVIFPVLSLPNRQEAFAPAAGPTPMLRVDHDWQCCPVDRARAMASLRVQTASTSYWLVWLLRCLLN